MRERIFYALIFFSFVVFIFGVFLMDNFSQKNQCYAKTQQMGFEVKYTYWSGCLIEVTPGQWIPLDNYYFKQE